jgi:hypothetical protein
VRRAIARQHASASMTLNVYADVVGGMKKEAADSMDRLLT